MQAASSRPNAHVRRTHIGAYIEAKHDADRVLDVTARGNEALQGGEERPHKPWDGTVF